ncbi:MAG: formate/nitrite transporter family protein, partial [Acidimicrobiia bacterium]|nr:formate/nitrite transporter family protein [Acidimicrobiia bacterium]
MDDRLDDLPETQHLSADVVLLEMAEVGARRAVSLTTLQVAVLSIMAGAFIAVGALFSTLVASGVETVGVQRLLEGFGFSVGFFLVIMSGSLLFTEVNVEMPATLLDGDARTLASRVAKLWVLAAVGNLIGAWLVGQAVDATSDFGPEYDVLLREVVDAKMRFREIGGAEGWLRAVLSGMLGNWLVGMAAFLAVMGRTIIGKYIPIFLLVTAFVAS